MKIKIEGGTADHGENLCGTCRWYQDVEGQSGRTFARCSLLEFRVTEPVVKCNSYNNANEMSLYDMKETAWIVNPDGHKNPVGFKGKGVTVTKYSDLTEQQQEKIDREGDW